MSKKIQKAKNVQKRSGVQIVRYSLTILLISIILLYGVTLAFPELVNSDDGTFGSRFLILLHSLFFPVALLTFLSFVFGGSTKEQRNYSSSAIRNRILSAVGLSGIVGSYVFTAISTHIDFLDMSRNKFAYENIGMALLFLGFAATLLLVTSQKMVYWPLWSKQDRAKADERQLRVRQRVLELSYRYLIILLFVGGILTSSINENSFDPERLNLVVRWICALIVIGLPALVAAWQKDS